MKKPQLALHTMFKVACAAAALFGLAAANVAHAADAGNGNPHFGRNNPIMQAQVQSLSPSDMNDIAAYIESLSGNLVDKK